MLNAFFIIIVITVTGLFGGLLCLVYLPFKNRLEKSGKLTGKLSRRINRAFLISLGLFGVVIYYFKDYRTSSKDRLERISCIKLPSDYKVVRDEYQDMWQDYGILYDIQFDNHAAKELAGHIEASKYYNKNSFYEGVWSEKGFVTIDSVNAVWCKSPTGYVFSRQDKQTSYYIEFDTLTNFLKYNEGAD